ncbi:MAG: hypothetical protein LBR38_00225 [Synergistaceae bacterium]|nr:hypothetical protein [Synergistaceae bacterium]
MFIGFGVLSAPVVTFTLPMLSVVLPDLLDHEFRAKGRYFGRIVLLGAAWSAGYVLTWAAKWALASLILDDNVVMNGVNQVLYRSGGTDGVSLFYRLMAIVKNVYVAMPFSSIPDGYAAREALHQILANAMQMNLSMFGKLAASVRGIYEAHPFSVAAGFLTLAAALLAYAFTVAPLLTGRVKRRALGAWGWAALALLFLVPYVWYFVVANHSYVHSTFTFRAQVSSLWLLFILPHLAKE